MNIISKCLNKYIKPIRKNTKAMNNVLKGLPIEI